MTSTIDREVRSLRQLAERHGVAWRYEDTSRTVRETPPEVLVGVLRALGVALDGVDDAARHLAAPAEPPPPVPSVVVTAPTDDTRVALQDPLRGRWELADDAGSSVASGEIDGSEIALGRLPIGFWDLAIDLGARSVSTRIFCAPATCYVDPHLARSWGVFAPLHAVRHHDRAGHLGDVRTIADAMRGRGGRIVAVLPLLATFLGDDPYEPSPYQPVSRRFFSELYIDPTRLPAGLRAPSLPVAPPATDDLVDHRALQARGEALVEHVRSALRDDDSARAALGRFRDASNDVDDYARFRATVERHGPNPATFDGDPDRVEHHLVSQWLLDHQLRELRDDLGLDGQALALDLPVGSHPAGYDVYRHASQYARAAVGAPPDDFFVGGQNWGFPPLHPVRSRNDGHRAFTDSVAALARYAGVLRIDHILGLHRLWWIPDSFRADEGAYVHYALDELLAAVCILSHQHETVMVGENLGTVPPEVTDAMARRGVLGMHEEQFVVGDPPPDGLPAIPATTSAGVNTHDMPPFAGFWTGADVRTQADLGQIDADDVDAAIDARRSSVERYRTLVSAELGREVADDRVAVFTAAVERLARSDADQVMINIEDLWGETRPQNVPGTSTEVPNWRRRMAHPVEDGFASADAAPALEVLAASRGRPNDHTHAVRGTAT